MSMPHPRVLMIPFGAVIKIKQNRSRTWVDIYTGASKIDGLHKALKGLGAIIAPNDDLPLSDTYLNYGHPSVIAAASVALKRIHIARKLHDVKGAKIAPVSAAEFQKPMQRDYFYWLEPAKKPAKKKKTK
jgi:hypothetical protein